MIGSGFEQGPYPGLPSTSVLDPLDAKGYEHSSKVQIENTHRACFDRKQLAPKSELSKECAVSAVIFLPEIVEKASSLTHDLE
jgi:hypothetical protein